MTIRFEEIVGTVEPDSAPQEETEARAAQGEPSKEMEMQQMRLILRRIKAREMRLHAD